MQVAKIRGAALMLTAILTLGLTPFSAAQGSKRVTVPAGTRILVRMVDSVDSSKQKAGYRFKATLEANLQAFEVTVAPERDHGLWSPRAGIVIGKI